VADITAPAALSYTGGVLRTSRIVPARLRFTGGVVGAGVSTPTTTAVEIPVLDRLTSMEQLTEGDGTPTVRLMSIWQDAMERIESAFEAVNARVDEVALYARLSAVEAKADAANDNAIAAKQTAEVTSVAVQETFTQVDPIYGQAFADRIVP